MIVHKWYLGQSVHEIQDTVLKVDDFIFRLKYISGVQPSQIALHLETMPKELGGVLINYSLNAPAISFQREHRGICMKTNPITEPHRMDSWNKDLKFFIS